MRFAELNMLRAPPHTECRLSDDPTGGGSHSFWQTFGLEEGPVLLLFAVRL